LVASCINYNASCAGGQVKRGGSSGAIRSQSPIIVGVAVRCANWQAEKYPGSHASQNQGIRCDYAGEVAASFFASVIHSVV